MEADGDDYSRVPSLWFDDGTLVIRSQKTLFKVHRSVLSARSSVFRDMLAFPQSNSGMDTFEDCPLVELTDGPGDFLVFLLAIYDSRSTSLSSWAFCAYLTSTISSTSSGALSPISMDICTSDEEYNFLFKARHPEGTITVPDDTGVAANWDPSKPKTSAIALIGIIQALTAVEAQWLLPVARYWLSSMPIETLINIPPEIMDGDALREVLRLRQSLVRERGLAVSELHGTAMYEDEQMPCDTPEDCATARVRALAGQLGKNFRGGDARMFDYIDVTDFGLCSPCLDANLWAQAQFDAWDALPDYFNLPDWTVLKAQRKMVLGLSD
ncbi:hypothetical protein C8F01DRAFT_1230801 [Mycena amicta]|nr:hypothetical protein C8F01DRAFT_1230801 [Mycena amicta]